MELSPAARVVAPDHAANAAGDAIVVWTRQAGDVCADAPENPACVHIVEAISRTPGSASWEGPVEIARPGVGAFPRVAVDPAGNAVVVWSHDIGEPRVLQASFRRGRSGAWDFPVDLSDARFWGGTQQIGMDFHGNAIAAWLRSGPAGRVVEAAVRPAESGVWGSPTLLSPNDDGVVGVPRLAVGPGGEAEVAWMSSGRGMLATRRRPAGTWEPPVELFGADVAVIADIDVAVGSGGDAAAVWTAHRSVGSVVHAAFRPARGSWTPAVGIATTPFAGSATPRVAVDPSGNVHTVWVGQRELAYTSTRARAGSGWSEPVAISPRNRGVTEPRIAVDAAGNAVAAWTDAEGMAVASIRPAGGPWQAAVEVSRPNIPTGGVRIAMGRVGAALAVWSRFEPGRVRVEASELGGAGPVLSGLSVPATGRAGVEVAFAVEPLAWAAPLAGEPAWSFGDGGTAAGATARHVYARPGRYTVSVTSADAGGTSTAEAAIVISASPPVNVVRPSIRGRPRVGAVLTCRRGTWTGTLPIRFSYRWLRNAAPIHRAASPRYRVVRRDRGARITCRVTATNAAGTKSAASKPVRVPRG